MVDVALYGNLTKDIIFNGFEQTTSIGSIGNVWDALVKLNQKLSIHIEPTTIGTALIYVDTDNNTRVSKPNLYLKTNKPKVSPQSVCVGCLFLRSPSRVPYRTEPIPRAPKGRHTRTGTL